jgi:hypothetical protein
MAAPSRLMFAATRPADGGSRGSEPRGPLSSPPRPNQMVLLTPDHALAMARRTRSRSRCRAPVDGIPIGPALLHPGSGVGVSRAPPSRGRGRPSFPDHVRHIRHLAFRPRWRGDAERNWPEMRFSPRRRGGEIFPESEATASSVIHILPARRRRRRGKGEVLVPHDVRTTCHGNRRRWRVKDDGPATPASPFMAGFWSQRCGEPRLPAKRASSSGSCSEEKDLSFRSAPEVVPPVSATMLHRRRRPPAKVDRDGRICSARRPRNHPSPSGRRATPSRAAPGSSGSPRTRPAEPVPSGVRTSPDSFHFRSEIGRARPPRASPRALREDRRRGTTPPRSSAVIVPAAACSAAGRDG